MKRSTCVLSALAALAIVVAGCGGQSSGGGTDTNTNWLKHCDEDADCNGLSCLCNVCTAPCDDDAACAGRGTTALCTTERNACGQGARICVADTTTGAAGSSGAATGTGGNAAGSGNATTSTEEQLGSCGQPASDYFGDFRCEDTGVVCLPPSEPFADRCGCGCTSVEAYPRACRSQCGFDFDCAEVSIDSQDTFAAIEQAWTTICPTLAVLEGRCSDGKVFLFYSNGYTGQVRYYDATRERTLGVGAFTDSLDRACGGQRYWPEPVLCDTPTATRVICGGIEVGYVFPDLPWADGRPGDLP